MFADFCYENLSGSPFSHSKCVVPALAFLAHDSVDFSRPPLAHRISAHGAVLSEQPPWSRPTVSRLMARNRLTSGLSKGVIVIEAAETGGSLQTVRNARRQGRLVAAVEWSGTSRESAGTRRLLAEGAIPVRGPEDVPQLAARLREHKPPILRPREERPGEEQLSLF